MKIKKKGKLLKIYISENQKYKRKPLFHVIVEKAKEEDLEEITVYRGIEGLGTDKKIHTSHILTLSDDLPIVLELIDSEKKIHQFLDILDDIIKEGLVIITDDIEIIQYSK
ncbi:MAG: uncharacterized protein PWQ37_1253 [Candidatus Petromonas sp.]|jgi:PII-like signaling protein|nr:uncharacterized protein [Candidatus Petromonas sp.]